MLMSIPTKYFTYNKETKTFIAEVSSLPKSFNFLRHGAFDLISHKTGKKVRFSFSHTDGHEDVAGWWFNIVPSDFALRGLKVLIIND